MKSFLIEVVLPISVMGFVSFSLLHYLIVMEIFNGLSIFAGVFIGILCGMAGLIVGMITRHSAMKKWRG